MYPPLESQTLLKEDAVPPVNTKLLAMAVLAKLMLCIMVMIGIATLYDGAGTYIAVGPSDSLILMSVYVNTMSRYLMLQIFLISYELVRVITSDIANPIMGWSIFNPDKVRVRGISRIHLQFYANSFWLLNRLMSVFEILVTLTQIDIAILRGIYSELISIITIRWLLNKKVFDEDIKSENTGDNNV